MEAAVGWGHRSSPSHESPAAAPRPHWGRGGVPETRNHQPAELTGVKLTLTLKKNQQVLKNLGQFPPNTNYT